MWQNLEWNSFLYLPHYSRLIAKMRLVVCFEGTEFNWRADPISERYIWVTKTLQNACKVLSLNDVKFLKVEYFNDLGWHCSSSRRGLGERCLEPLKKCRAERVSVASIQIFPLNLKLILTAVRHQYQHFSSLRDGLENRDRRSEGCGIPGLSPSSGRRACNSIYSARVICLQTKGSVLKSAKMPDRCNLLMTSPERKIKERK